MSEERTAPAAYGGITVICQGDGTQEGWCGTTVSTPLEVEVGYDGIHEPAECPSCGRAWVVMVRVYGVSTEEESR